MSDAPIQSYRDLRVWREAMRLAEGYGRENTGNYIQFLRIAQGSCKEVETHTLLAQRVLDGIGSPQPLLDQCDAVGKMLHGLIRSLQ